MTSTPTDAVPVTSEVETAPGSSAGALLFTVLGEYLREPGSTAWTGTLVAALGELGHGTVAARRALSRVAAAGWVVPERIGRRTRWSPSPAAVEHFAESARAVYGSGRRPAPWDGQWLVVLTQVPETQRALRHRLRTRLRWAGFGPAAPGVWISPRPEARERVRPLLGDLGLAATSTSFVGGLGPLGSEYELVREAWDLGELSRDYRDLVASLEERDPDGAPRELFVRLTTTVHRWRGFHLRDPGLPAELLPAGWVGLRAHELFHARHEAWSGPARRWLADLDAAADS